MNVDWQLMVVAAAAGAAAVYALRRTLLQFQRPDDEPCGCRGCPASRVASTRSQKKSHAP